MRVMVHGLFHRMLLRCAEVASEAGMKASVTGVYNDTLKLAAEAFLSANDDVKRAMVAVQTKGKSAAKALSEFDALYREGRSVVQAYAPDTALPETLAVQRTDTDKLDAIDKLRRAVNDHSGQAWADSLAQGEFGQKAAATVQALTEKIAADAALDAARNARGSTIEPAYESYLRFKRVVRNGLGRKSRQYRRIHLRSRDAEETASGEQTTPAEAPAEITEPAPQSETQPGPASAGSAASQPA